MGTPGQASPRRDFVDSETWERNRQRSIFPESRAWIGESVVYWGEYRWSEVSGA